MEREQALDAAARAETAGDDELDDAFAGSSLLGVDGNGLMRAA